MPSQPKTLLELFQATHETRLTWLIWNALLTELQTRQAELLALKPAFEETIATAGELIDQKVDQALTPALSGLTEEIEQFIDAKEALFDTALSNLNGQISAVQALLDALGSGVPIETITGLTAALAAKATPADITAAIDALKGGVGTALDTLAEFAAALANDPNFAATITTALGNRYTKTEADALFADAKLYARRKIHAYTLK